MEIKRLFEFLDYQLAEHPQEVCLATKKASGWEKYSTKEVKEIVDEMSLGLIELGVKPGDKVAIATTTNRAEWNFIDLACLQIGAIDVPVYPTISEKDYIYIFDQAEVKFCFVSDKPLYNKMQKVKDQVSYLQDVFIFNDVAGCKNWKEVKDLGKGKDKTKVEERKANVKYEDLATIIYTSGTTGDPKGVMLSHSNLISNALASSLRLPVDPGARSVSFLPLCHSFERMLIYLYMYKGVQVHYAESMETIGDNLKEVSPMIFTAVPRLYEKVFDKIIAKGNELTGIKKKLFFWAVSLGEKFEYYNKNGAWYNFKLSIARKVIFSKWQEALGGQVKLAASGSAALSERLCRIFNAAGIPIMEGYGLTETSPVISVNEIENDGFRFGTTGRPIKDVEVKIAEDGEILCKGPNIMMGYYKDPEKTAEAIDKDGWFHTGDIGVLQEGQFVKITDRKKEIFKTSGGKYIAPQPMENIYKQSPFIEQIMVVGENEKHSSAIVVPSFEYLKGYCKKNGIEYASNEEVIKDPKINSLIQSEIEKYNTQFGKWEQVKKPKLIPQEFTIDGGELTPTLKLKRKVIMAKYADAIADIYKA
ncbi:MAG: long-chain fatty acid--CoA ligase [Flavobacteriales bacterium]|nr:long-chain fatty acid--CoA ligase [Flavobacteriales bacterium]